MRPFFRTTRDNEKGSTMRATILLVDDDADIRELLELLLTGEGYAVLQAESGEAAIRPATIYFEKLRCLIKLFLRFSLEININTKQNRTVHRIFQTIISTKFRIPQFERRET